MASSLLPWISQYAHQSLCCNLLSQGHAAAPPSEADLAATRANVAAFKAAVAALSVNRWLRPDQCLTPDAIAPLMCVLTSPCAHLHEVARRVEEELTAAIDRSTKDDVRAASRAALWQAGVPAAVMAVVDRLMDASTPRSEDQTGALVSALVTLRRLIASDAEPLGWYTDGVTAGVAGAWSAVLQRVLAEYGGNVDVVRAVVVLYSRMSLGNSAACAVLVSVAPAVCSTPLRVPFYDTQNV